MDMGLSSWSLEPERDPGHVARQGSARRSREGFLEEVAWKWNEEEALTLHNSHNPYPGLDSTKRAGTSHRLYLGKFLPE